MRSFLLSLLTVLIIYSCQSQTDQIEFRNIEELFPLGKMEGQSGAYYQAQLSASINESSAFSELLNNNNYAASFIRWNLIDYKLPDSIKYSVKQNLDEIRSDYAQYLLKDQHIQAAFNHLLNPKFVHSISKDSLVSIGNQLFYAIDLGDNRMAWTVCTGPSNFTEKFGRPTHLNTVIYQAYCFQSIFEGDKAMEAFSKNIPIISPELNSVNKERQVKYANQRMYQLLSGKKDVRQEYIKSINLKAKGVINLY